MGLDDWHFGSGSHGEERSLGREEGGGYGGAGLSLLTEWVKTVLDCVFGGI